MIKLKQLIKEETIHSCECGGDCCSVNESKGMELGKVFTGHGFAFKKEELEDESCGYTDEIGIEEPELEEKVNKSDLKYQLDMSLDKFGIGTKALIAMKPKGRDYFLKMKSYMYKDSMEKVLKDANKVLKSKLKVKKFKKTSFGTEFIIGESINERLIDVDKQMKDGTFDERNPQIHIMGYGVMGMKTLGNALSRKFTDLAKRAKKGEIENVHSVLNKSGVLQSFVKAYMDATAQLKKPTMKRKITMYKRKR